MAAPLYANRTRAFCACAMSSDVTGLAADPKLRLARGDRPSVKERGHDQTAGGRLMRKLLLTLGLIALAMGLLWIGQGTGVVAWPRSSFMINQIEWAGYGAALSAVGLILIWQSQR
jgi:hypothetical protein